MTVRQQGEIIMSVKLVFIDVDNTLLDFDACVAAAMEAGFEIFGLGKFEPYMHDIFDEVNGSLWKELEKGNVTFEHIKKVRWNTVFAALGIEGDGEAFEEYFRSRLHDSTIPVNGAYELLDELKKEYIVCAASNGPYEQQIHRLTEAGMMKYFDFCFISEAVGASKPDREFFDYAFSRINIGRAEEILPEECVMIGDSFTSDISGGIAYGMKTCFFDKKKNAGGDISADVYADELSAVPELLRSL